MTDFPIDDVKSRFPALSSGENSPVFLDNPAGTLVPQVVVDAMSNAMLTASSNIGGMFPG